MALSPEIKDAVTHLQSHAQGMRAVLTIADAIGDVAALEQLATEAENRKAAAFVDVDKVNAQLAEAQGELDKANGAVKDAKTEADYIVADANSTARAMIAQAEADAQAAAAEEKRKADATLAGVNASIDKARTTLADVNTQVASGQRNVDDLTLQARDLDDRVAKAKAYLATLAAT